MLLPAKDDLVRRRWIWQALSDLFLDDNLTDADLRYIARIAAECGYSNEELELIYRSEVAPAVAFNLLDVAGTWGYFDSTWLEQRILQLRGPAYWFQRLVVASLPVWLSRKEWQYIKRMLPEERDQVQEKQQCEGRDWKPCYAEESPCLRWATADEDASV